MQVQIFRSSNIQKLNDKIDEFVSCRKVIDIKMNTVVLFESDKGLRHIEQEPNTTVLIMYED